MSADNYIFVDTKKKEAWSCVASCVCHHKKHCLKCQKLSFIKKVEDLGDIAEAYADTNSEDFDSEYGISFRLWCK